MLIILLFSKMLIKLLNLFGKGATSLPGKVALKLMPTILYRLSKNVYCICVTGTNGKTTTCAMIEKGLNNNNKPCFINKSGANMIGGVTTAFLKNTTVFGKPKCKYAVLECDENSFPLIANRISASVIVVTNVFRDQLDRYGEVNITLDRIKQGIDNSKNAIIILNADCPLTYSLSFSCSNDCLTFGINTNAQTFIASDSPFCPRCNGRLSYNSKVYAQLGDFYCTGCRYKREEPTVCASNICGDSFVLDGKRITLSIGGIYNIYNYLSATSVLKYLGLSSSSLSAFGGSFGRTESFFCNDNRVTVMLVKNPVGLANCLKLAYKSYGTFDSVFALNDNQADGTDVSWIWDVDFCMVNSNKCYTIGKRACDMALRLKYDGVASQVIDGENYDALVGIIKESTNDFVIFASYTAMMNLRHTLINIFGGEEFWQ